MDYQFVDNDGTGIAVDGAGDVYVAGSTMYSPPSPLGQMIGIVPTVNAFEPSVADDGAYGFVARLEPDGSKLDYASYLGGAYITGFASSSDFPTTKGALQPQLAGFTNAFVAKIGVGLKVIALSVAPIVNQPYTKPVAIFTAPNSAAPPSTFSATIDWGDGTIAVGTVTSTNDPTAPFQVAGNHTYSKAGDYPVVVTVTDLSATAASTPTTATTAYDVSQLLGDQSETTIAINPNSPTQVFAAANNLTSQVGIFAAYSDDGGVTWTPSGSSGGVIGTGAPGDLPGGSGGDSDLKVVFDQFGNLFLTYLLQDLEGKARTLVLAVSTDGGRTFAILGLDTNPSGVDQPSVAVGPGAGGTGGAVWLTYLVGANIVATGASVFGLGAANISPFGTPFQTGPGPTGIATRNFGDIAVGPQGQIVIDYQSPAGGPGPSTIFVNIDQNNSTSPPGFGADTTVVGTNVGGFYPIFPQNTRTIAAEANLAYDLSNGPHRGRLYLAYTDSAGPGSQDTNIFVIYSDNNGLTWSPTDPTTGQLRSRQSTRHHRTAARPCHGRECFRSERRGRGQPWKQLSILQRHRHTDAG